MSDIELKVGAKYKLRNGDIVGPMTDNNTPEYPYGCNVGGFKKTWTKNGIYVKNGTSILDIIECVEDPLPEFTTTAPTVQLFSEIPLRQYREAVAKRFEGDCIR